MSISKEQVLHILQRHYGNKNPITGKEIAELLNVRDTRLIRQLILELLQDGVAVASSVSKPFGYYITENATEADSYSAILKSYMREIAIHRWRFIKASYLQRTGQMQGKLL